MHRESQKILLWPKTNQTSTTQPPPPAPSTGAGRGAQGQPRALSPPRTELWGQGCPRSVAARHSQGATGCQLPSTPNPPRTPFPPPESPVPGQEPGRGWAGGVPPRRGEERGDAPSPSLAAIPGHEGAAPSLGGKRPGLGGTQHLGDPAAASFRGGCFGWVSQFSPTAPLPPCIASPSCPALPEAPVATTGLAGARLRRPAGRGLSQLGRGKESPRPPRCPRRAPPEADRRRLPLRGAAGGEVEGRLEPRVPGRGERGRGGWHLPAAGLRTPQHPDPPGGLRRGEGAGAEVPEDEG